MRHFVISIASLVACSERSVTSSSVPIAVQEVANDMIVVEEGEFTGPNGACPGESGQLEFTAGTHFQNEFSIDRRPVTCEDFERCISAQVCRARGTWDDPPCHVGLATVSRSDAKAYCEWRQAELPSIAQWHRAALGVNAKDLERSVPRCLPKPRSSDPFDHGNPEIPRCEQTGPTGMVYALWNPNFGEWTRDEMCPGPYKSVSSNFLIRLSRDRLGTLSTASSLGGEFRCVRSIQREEVHRGPNP